MIKNVGRCHNAENVVSSVETNLRRWTDVGRTVDRRWSDGGQKFVERWSDESWSGKSWTGWSRYGHDHVKKTKDQLYFFSLQKKSNLKSLHLINTGRFSPV